MGTGEGGFVGPRTLLNNNNNNNNVHVVSVPAFIGFKQKNFKAVKTTSHHEAGLVM